MSDGAVANFTHPYPYAEGERCGPCLRLLGMDVAATHKIEEASVDIRHPYTQYICCLCFGDMMGPVAIRACALANGEEPPDEQGPVRRELPARLDPLC